MSEEFYGFDDPDFDVDPMFDAWVRELDEKVIQGEYGYERGEFSVFPEMWRPLFDEGLTPKQAFDRALKAFDDERKRRDQERKDNWARIQAEDAKYRSKP